MMPQEKADGLLKKFRPHAKYWDCYNDTELEENHSKLSAIIFADGIILELEEMSNKILDIIKSDGISHDIITYKMGVKIMYWQEVKSILEKM